MADKEKHSPLPWNSCEVGEIRNEHNRIVAITRSQKPILKEDKANAEFIVHCCNTHAGLVEALEAVIGFQKAMERKSVNPDDVGDYHEAVIRQVEAALAEETK